MFIDACELPQDKTLRADLCIIGSGAAGVTLALEMRNSGYSVILAEAGGKRADADPTAVFGGEVCDPRHPPADLYRARALGGTTTLWGGRCAPFDPIDFAARPWVPHSGWPISSDEVERHYRMASAYLDLGRPAWHAEQAFHNPGGGLVPGLRDEDLSDHRLDRFSPVNFGARYHDDLAGSTTIRVVLNANCLRIGLTDNGEVVDCLHMASRPGRTFTIRARAYVLAAGGLETARLLLLSDDVMTAGVGNGNDLVGRFYMCHLQGKAGVVRLKPEVTGVTHAYAHDRDGVYVRRRLSISERAQRRHGLMNFAARYEHPAIPDPDHRSGILSAMYLSRHFLKKEYARRLASCGINGELAIPDAAQLRRHLRNVLFDFPGVLWFAANWFPRRKFVYRRIPYVTLPNRDNAFHLDYYAEQAPNPDSRVTLMPDTDPFGRRRLKVDWRVSDQDRDSLVGCYRLMQQRLRTSGLGELEFDDERLRASVEAIGGHHIGTTRMAAHPAQGVVDRDCKVFGVENLFIASAATFPTCSHASPTFTITAMAVRLARHVKDLFHREAVPRPVSQKVHTVV